MYLFNIRKQHQSVHNENITTGQHMTQTAQKNTY